MLPDGEHVHELPEFRSALRDLHGRPGVHPEVRSTVDAPTPAPTTMVGHYVLRGDRLGELTRTGGTVLVDGMDTALDRPVAMAALPVIRSPFERVRQRRTASRFSAGTDCLVQVLDVVEDRRRVYLVLPADARELLGERLGRERLPLSAAARLAVDVLVARTFLRVQGSPGPAMIDPHTVVVGPGHRARLLPLPCDGTPALDDVSPVWAFFNLLVGDYVPLGAARAPAELRIALGRLASERQVEDEPRRVSPPAPVPPPPWAAAPLVAELDPSPPSASEPKPAAAGCGGSRQRRRRTAAVLIAVLNLLVTGAAAATVWFHRALAPVAAPTPAPVAAVPRPTTLSGLLAVVTSDPSAAGIDGPLLRGDLTALASDTGEGRRQDAVRVLMLAASGRLAPGYAGAAAAVATPYTMLDTPADVIADLAADPAAGGPNAHLVLNCMLAFQGRSQQEQRAEAGEVLTRIPRWARNGGIRQDLVAAVVRIVTPVARGTATFTDAQTGFDPAGPRSPGGA